MLSSITFTHCIVIFPLDPLALVQMPPVNPRHVFTAEFISTPRPRHYTSTPAPPRNSGKMGRQTNRDKDGHDHETPKIFSPPAPSARPLLYPLHRRRRAPRPLGRHLGSIAY